MKVIPIKMFPKQNIFGFLIVVITITYISVLTLSTSKEEIIAKNANKPYNTVKLFGDNLMQYNSDYDKDQNDLTNDIFNTVKILCLISSSHKQIENRAIHVNATWAKRCNKQIFISYHEDYDLPFFYSGHEEVTTTLWARFKATYRWVVQNIVENYDFILKTDDDSYFIMENLRFFLLPFNPEEPLYLGTRMKKDDVVKKGFMTGGGGFVLSRTALKQMMPFLDDPEICAQDPHLDDVNVGHCAWKLNFTYIDMLDSKGRYRQLPYPLHDSLVTGLSPMDAKNFYYSWPNKAETFADYMISFHYLDKTLIHSIDFLLYHTRIMNPFDKFWNDIIQKYSNYSISLLDVLKEASMKYNYQGR